MAEFVNRLYKSLKVVKEVCELVEDTEEVFFKPEFYIYDGVSLSFTVEKELGDDECGILVDFICDESVSEELEYALGYLAYLMEDLIAEKLFPTEYFPTELVQQVQLIEEYFERLENGDFAEEEEETPEEPDFGEENENWLEDALWIEQSIKEDGHSSYKLTLFDEIYLTFNKMSFEREEVPYYRVNLFINDKFVTRIIHETNCSILKTVSRLFQSLN
jgi:hypothetical protein|nr:MAG TPA: hypothetical protein [Caudoviricetes sp.]